MAFILEGLRVVFSQRAFFLLIVIMTALYHLIIFTTYRNNYRSDNSYWSVFIKRHGIHRFKTTGNQGSNNLSECPVIPPGLQGRLIVHTNVTDWVHIEKQNPNVAVGGRYKPLECLARHRVAIIIPYRDRESHLKVLLRHLHPFLQRQQLDYGIYVVEMPHGLYFNKAYLMNIAFVEAMKQYDYECFIFHDVDLLPEDDRILYTCPTVPRHMSTAIDILEYKLPYSLIFGGVVAIPTNQFRLINGYSNLYFGWGGEDDDFCSRIIHSNLIPIRYSGHFARYKMLTHGKTQTNYQRWRLLKTVKERQSLDGLSSLKYKLISIQKKPLFTWIYVSLNIPELSKSMKNIIKGSGNLTPQKNMEEKKTTELVRQNKIAWNIVNGKMIPPFVDWVPSDYTGQIPDYLSKF